VLILNSNLIKLAIVSIDLKTISRFSYNKEVITGRGAYLFNKTVSLIFFYILFNSFSLFS
jgi:hypothetical protein